MRKLEAMILVAATMVLGACTVAGGSEEVAALNAGVTPAPLFNGDPANGALFAVDVSVWETPLAQSQMDCFWASGVRHVIVGTQQEDITRQQLGMAVSRGMTVDAYVYLYWTTDVSAQVKEAFHRVSGFPIGRMWLDIEQPPGSLGSTKLDALIQKAVTACNADGNVPCGMYTGQGFWKSYTSNTTAFDAVPLWYAHYDGRTSLSNWPSESFGGWTKPVAKQFASKPLCGAGGADWDVMQVSAQPTVIVDRSVPPDDGMPPAAPTGLFPADGSPVALGYAKIMSGLVPGATSYELAVESWSGSAWIPYATWTNPDAFQLFDPATSNALYHFRVRAQNAHGWGPWSAWSAFDYGTYTGPLPAGQPPSSSSSSSSSSASTGSSSGSSTSSSSSSSGSSTSSSSSSSASSASSSSSSSSSSTSSSSSSSSGAPSTGVPTGLAPDGGLLITTQSVTLTCAGLAGATEYQFDIESQSGSGYAPYYTYSVTTASKVFYPQIHGIGYRWRVRAEVAGTFGAWSGYAAFQFE